MLGGSPSNHASTSGGCGSILGIPRGLSWGTPKDGKCLNGSLERSDGVRVRLYFDTGVKLGRVMGATYKDATRCVSGSGLCVLN